MEDHFFVVLMFINVIRRVESINLCIKTIKMIYFNNHMFKKNMAWSKYFKLVYGWVIFFFFSCLFKDRILIDEVC